MMDSRGMVAVPLCGKPIVPGTKIKPEHLLDPATHRPYTVHIRPGDVRRLGLVTDATRIVGRVASRRKDPDTAFKEEDFLLEDAASSPMAAATPPARRSEPASIPFTPPEGHSRSDRASTSPVERRSPVAASIALPSSSWIRPGLFRDDVVRPHGGGRIVIDVGFAVVAHRQMQTVADGATLEGLRLRDEIPPQWTDPQTKQLDDSIQQAMKEEELDPSNKDQVRRWAASAIVTPIFDNNFNHDPTAPRQRIVLEGGIGGEINASQMIDTPDAPLNPSRPVLQPNIGNDTRGDLVAGTYSSSSTSMDHMDHLDHSEGPVDVQTSQRNNYDRGDFLPTNPGNAFLRASAADHNNADRAFGRDASRRHH